MNKAHDPGRIFHPPKAGILKASEGTAKLWGKLRNRFSGKVQSLAVRKEDAVIKTY